MFHQYILEEVGEDKETYYYTKNVKNKKELQKLYSKEGSYTVGILFNKEEYNDYKNRIKTYKYSDFFLGLLNRKIKSFL